MGLHKLLVVKCIDNVVNSLACVGIFTNTNLWPTLIIGKAVPVNVPLIL